MCNGELGILGTLGTTKVCMCRDCGMQYLHTPKTKVQKEKKK